MSKKHSKQTEKQLIEIINSNSNLNRCGECGSDYPTWASWNLGILLCGKCANCHKKVLSTGGPRGEPISKVKSLTLEVWSDSQIEKLRSIGNRSARQKWNPKKVPFPYNDDGDDGPIEAYLREKYILGNFRYDSISGDDTSDSRRSSSKPLPRLSHRKLTSYELSQYISQAGEILSLGYRDRDAVVESLILSKGNLDYALDILAQDAKINPRLDETPPDLPRRPPPSAKSDATAPLQATTSTAPSTANSAEWWSGSQQTGAAFNAGVGIAVQSPQIYQYTDPVSGQVSYIDSNGQQYLDPSNPHHQTMMMQATNPQLLARQQTNQNILSLYNQPTAQLTTQQMAQSNAQMHAMQPNFTQGQQPLMQFQPQMTTQMGMMQNSQAATAQNPYYTGQVNFQPQGYVPSAQQSGGQQQFRN